MTYLPYVEQGDADGVPIVMLHGVTDSWRSFEPVLPHLPDSIRAIVVTQRGHGDAPKPDGGYTIPQLAEDVVELMDDLGIERAIVVGHSMGGWVAQRMAIDHPERMLGVVLAASFGRAVRDVPELAAFCEEMATAQDPIPEELAREFQESTVATPLQPEMLDTFVAESLKLPARVWRAAFGGFLDINHRDDLGEIRAPTLIVWGDEDAFIPREDQEVLEEALENARLLVFEGIGHALHWEQPERFAADVAEFSRYCAGQPLSR